jgi:hypothetical protein
MPTEFVEMGNTHKLAGSTVRLAAKNFGFTMNIAYTGLFFLQFLGLQYRRIQVLSGSLPI